MRKLIPMALSLLLAISTCSPSIAQQLGRPQDGFYSGQANGQVDERVDGRANKNEGLPPSAADKANRRFENPISQDDCAEVAAMNPDARPGWQARINAACNGD
jgi:hypothetical protein